MELIQLIYTSQASRDLSADDLKSILDASVRNNQVSGITGMLVYCAGTFLQALEGDEAAVNDVMARIQTDPRHTDIQTQLRSQLGRREFDTWAMGFRTVGPRDSARWPGYADIFSKGFSPDTVGAHPGLALDIILTLAGSADQPS